VPLQPAVTNSEGRFTINGVAAGTYRALADKEGYAPQLYGAAWPGMNGFVGITNPELIGNEASIVRVQITGPTEELIFRLTPAAAVSGRIVTPTGEPLVGAQVELLPVGYDASGRRIALPLARTSTDDRGEFRLFNVEPGRYYLGARMAPIVVSQQGTATQAGVSPGSAGRDQKYTQTYFPGTTDPTRATLLEIAAGENQSRLDMTMVPTSRNNYSVRGRIIDGTNNQPPTIQSVMSGGVTLIPRDTMYLNGLPAQDPRLRPDGTFELLNVAPGRYWLNVRAQLSLPRPQPGEELRPVVTSVASVPIDVIDVNLAGLLVTLQRPFTLIGKLISDGPLSELDGTHVQLSTVRVGAFSMNMMGNPASVAARSDGQLTFAGVGVGEYELTVTGLPSTAFVKEARFGGDSVLGKRFSIAGPTAELIEIYVSSKGGRLSGTVRGRVDQPSANTFCVLVPWDQPLRRDLFKVAKTDSNGRFSMRGIAPGEYKVFAWSDVPRFAYYDPEFLQRFEAAGRNVRITEAVEDKVDIRVIEPRIDPGWNCGSVPRFGGVCHP
jgi:protocatechuate 3,4-dioxygenase beta subunit